MGFTVGDFPHLRCSETPTGPGGPPSRLRHPRNRADDGRHPPRGCDGEDSPGATCQDVALVAGTIKDECLCFQLAFKVMAGEPAAFISRAARRPQSAAESKRGTAK
jgi:hypothetical protein